MLETAAGSLDLTTCRFFLGAVLQLDLLRGGDLGQDLGFAVRLASVLPGNVLQRDGVLLLVHGVALQAALLLGQGFGRSGIDGMGQRGAEQRRGQSGGGEDRDGFMSDSPGGSACWNGFWGRRPVELSAHASR